jgi:hypothetical protein
LLGGEFDEEAGKRSFQEALREWRRAGGDGNNQTMAADASSSTNHQQQPQQQQAAATATESVSRADGTASTVAVAPRRWQPRAAASSGQPRVSSYFCRIAAAQPAAPPSPPPAMVPERDAASPAGSQLADATSSDALPDEAPQPTTSTAAGQQPLDFASLMRHASALETAGAAAAAAAAAAACDDTAPAAVMIASAAPVAIQAACTPPSSSSYQARLAAVLGALDAAD